MNPKYTVKQIQESDITQELANSISQLVIQLGPKYPPTITAEGLKTLLAIPHNYLITAASNEQIIGMVMISSLHVPSGIKTWIEDMVVDENYRSQGVGKALIKHAIKVANVNNVTHINLTTKPARIEANKLYQSVGFEINETNYYRLVLK
jgi:ribosomal protein S18 acetylase RimI-like enzyme